MFEKLADLYLDYFNNYLTIEGMSDSIGIETEKLRRMLWIGQNCHERRVRRAKSCPDQQLLDQLFN